MAEIDGAGGIIWPDDEQGGGGTNTWPDPAFVDKSQSWYQGGVQYFGRMNVPNVPSFATDDLQMMFTDVTMCVPVIWGALETLGIFNIQGEDFVSIVASKHYSLLMRASDFGATDPKKGDAITVDGDDYTVNSFKPLDDGKIYQLELSKV